jgi:hypothetical protein
MRSTSFSANAGCKMASEAKSRAAPAFQLRADKLTVVLLYPAEESMLAPI